MSGVTLIELIITIALVAILTSLAIPSFQGILAKSRAAGLANELSGALQFARSEAVKRGRIVTVCKSSTVTAAVTTTAPSCDTTNTAPWPDGWLVFVDQGTNGVRDGSNDTLLKVGQPAATNHIQAGSDFTKSVSFNPTGVSSGTGNEAARTITICVAPEQRNLVISRTGQIRITKGGCT